MRGSPFFEGVHQIGIEIGGQPSKTPTFYYDAGYMEAVFAARLSALRKLMPDPRYVPARLAPGVGVVTIACMQYHDTDIGPYNEVAIGTPIVDPWFRANLPGRALLEAERTGVFHEFVLHLPVTTEVALRGGVDFYNFPKFIAGIEFRESGARLDCSVAEGKEPILTLRGKRIPAPRARRMEVFSHLWMDGQPQTAQLSVNCHEAGSTLSRGVAGLELGARHPIALELRELLLSLRPIAYDYAPKAEAILFGPEHLSLPLAKRAFDAIDAIERHPVIS